MTARPNAPEHTRDPESPRSEPERDPFFIVGTGRCGSTLLQAMLMCHSRIAIPPETHFFAVLDPARHFRDPLPPADSEAWLARTAQAATWRALAISESELRSAVESGHRDARTLFLWLLGRLLGEAARAPRWGEKTPRHEQFVPRIAALFPDARFVHVRRDPRDVVASIRERPWRSSDDVAALARECRRTYRRQARFAAELGPERYLDLRYEDLVGDPERELRRVCAFLGEDFEPTMLRYHERPETGFVQEERAWKEDTQRPLDGSRVQRYRAALSASQIRRIEGVLAAELPRLGYAPDPGTDSLAWQLANWREALRARWKRRRRGAALGDPAPPGR